jgi:predicted kinase
LLGEPADLVDLDNLEKWTEQEFIARSNTFAKRKIDGFVRECHGDLHLGNVALVNGEMLFFDCIEFSEDLRWIDVMSEVAFLFMDLQAHERSDFGYRFINAYLEETGDYAGLSVLRFYVVYRAIVRAEITLLRMPQCNGEDRAELAKIARSYLDLAKRWTQPMQPISAALILTHGLSGSGKTTVSQDILQAVGAIRLRSDVERKRLAGMPATISSQSEIGEGLYASDATEATYRRLFTLAQSILNAGYTVIVDATFLQSKQRGMFSMWADKHRIPFSMVSVTAPQSVLRERITQREQEGNDPSEASLSVLDHQLRVQQPFSPDELPSVIFCDFSRSINEAGSLGAWRADLIDEINNKICNKGGQTAVLSGIITT